MSCPPNAQRPWPGGLLVLGLAVSLALGCAGSDERSLDLGDGVLVETDDCLRLDAADGGGSTCGDSREEEFAHVVGSWVYGIAPPETTAVRVGEREQTRLLDIDGAKAFAAPRDPGEPVVAEAADGEVLVEYDLGRTGTGHH